MCCSYSHGRPNWRTPRQGEAHHSRTASTGPELSEGNGGKLGHKPVKMGFVKDEEITALLSRQYGVPSINLASSKSIAAVIKLIPARHRPEIPDGAAQPRRGDAARSR